MLRTLTILASTIGLSDAITFSWEDCGASEGAHVKLVDMWITPANPKLGDVMQALLLQAAKR